MSGEVIATIIVAVIAALATVAGPLWIDVRKSEREAESEREATRSQAAELAATAHREAIEAKDREIAYWRDRYLNLIERGQKASSR